MTIEIDFLRGGVTIDGINRQNSIAMLEGKPKSPEQFDFSKPEDAERFEKLDEESKKLVVDEAYSEAGRLEDLVQDGVAIDYADAAEYVAAKHEYAEVENRVKEVEKKKIDDLTRRLKDIEETVRFYENGAISNAGDFGSEGRALAKRIDSIVYLRHKPLEKRLKFLEEEGQSELAEQYSHQNLKSMGNEIERYGRNGRTPCKRCFLQEHYRNLADGVLTINDPETIMDKSRRLLTMLAKMQNWYSDEGGEGEGSGDAGVAFATDNILELVDHQWLSMPAERQKEFIEMALNEMKPVLDTGRNSHYDYWKNHFDNSKLGDARSEIAHLIASSESDPEYRVNALKEWSEKFSNELIPIDALSVIMRSDKVDKEQKRAFVDEIWKRFNTQSARAYEKERNMRPYVDYIMQALLSAAEAKVEIHNFGKIIETLVKKTKQINQRGFGNYKSGMLADIEIGEEKIKSLLEQSSKNLESGFSRKEAEYARGTKLYLDGKFLGIAENAQFSNQPSNGEIVAWVSRELIDYDRAVKGSQWRHNIFVWKKGWDSPKRIFEDHAYDSERQFNVLPPVVTPDGKIEVEELDAQGKTEKRTLDVE